MAKYGAKNLKFAPFSGDEPASALPTYGVSIKIGELMKVTDAPTYSTAKIYGDNKTAEDVTEFVEAAVTTEVTEISNANASVVFGASNVTDLEYGAEDTAPYGGVSFYINKMVNKVKKYQGVFYPKCKATVQGEEFTTKGESITLAGGNINFAAYTPNYGKWKVVSEYYNTEAQAEAWANAKLGGTAYHAVDITTNGAGAGESVSPLGLNYVANAGTIAITITGTCAALYDNGVESKIDIIGGTYTLANVTAAHEIAVIF